MSITTRENKRLLCVILSFTVFLTIVFCAPVSANAEQSEFYKNGILYKLSEDGVTLEVAGYDESATPDEAFIEPVVKNRKVKAVGESAFANCHSLKKVSIPSSIKRIEYNAFRNCDSLSRVQFESNSQLSEIGNRAFASCDVLTAVNLPQSLKSIGDYAFNNCERLTTVVMREGLESIGVFAFTNCGMQKVEIPFSVKEMGYYCVGFNASWDGDIEWVRNFTVYGLKDSVAELYAKSFDFEFSYGAPLLLSVSNAENGVRLEFKGNYNIDGTYSILRKTENTSWTQLCEVKAKNNTNTVFADENVVSGERYTYTVRFADSNGVLGRYNKDGLTVIYNVYQPPEKSAQYVSDSMKACREFLKNHRK